MENRDKIECINKLLEIVPNEFLEHKDLETEIVDTHCGLSLNIKIIGQKTPRVTIPEDGPSYDSENCSKYDGDDDGESKINKIYCPDLTWPVHYEDIIFNKLKICPYAGLCNKLKKFVETYYERQKAK